ncbi:uncharacterized protein GGS25DRAFT_421466 [Hypoxylon fragiforme]|uniref:uncharacterized protein n=1 Tax=Hypoxylon fragiforme TaxID=63214 RepID=UPI0020C6FE7C|nr:uncharacterized protein GGS25DRAFT_421466 [Hypoxylon fragiforme]KAI2605223.1 hypothetical protein GGS25DRAFT_421466 [Hypoxylon fragiforme]
MAAEAAIHNGPSRIERLSPEDFETASVRSAAPSYISDAPSYHSTIPPNESVPAYTPRDQHAPPSSMPPPPRYASSSSYSMLNPSAPSPSPTPIPMTSTFAPGAGLPRIPSPRRRGGGGGGISSSSIAAVPQLNHFSIPSWSSMNSNPTARLYQRVAHRRVSAAVNGGRHSHNSSWGSSSSSSSSSGAGSGVATAMIDRMNAVAAAAAAADDDDADPDMVRRPLEDPYLVGEEAAAKARRERLARQKKPGEDVLYREEQRWDWLLGQMKDWDERDRSWTSFGSPVESRGRLARRFGR